MYFHGIFFQNARQNDNGRFIIKTFEHKIRKWTVLSASESSRELLQLIALACGGPSFIPRLPVDLAQFKRVGSEFLQLEFLLAPHEVCDGRSLSVNRFGSGLKIDGTGQVSSLRPSEYRLLPFGTPVKKLFTAHGNSRYFLLGYSTGIRPWKGHDDYDFEDPFHRLRRFLALFDHTAMVTAPWTCLQKLHYRAVLKSRYPAKQTMKRLRRLLGRYLDMDTESWVDRNCDFRLWWYRLKPPQQQACLPLIDMVRHTLDAFPGSGRPLNQPGLILLDRADQICHAENLPHWISLLDRLLPFMQVVMTLPETHNSRLPEKVIKRRLPLPPQVKQLPARKPVSSLPPSTILLIHVDGRLPNLALMKLSAHFKAQGKGVILAKGVPRIKTADQVYASCVFSNSSSREKQKKLKDFYGRSLILGGSGVNIDARLPGEIEDTAPDYALYPELKERAMGFITRGCPFHCAFCIVPRKEGAVHQVSTIKEILQGNRSKIILLDDNILSHENAGDFLEEMARRNLQVNFNQTLDIRLLDRELAGLLRRVRCSNTRFTRQNYHFSLNDAKHLDEVREKYEMMRFRPHDNVEFVCMYGYDTCLREDVERFEFLRSLPGAYVFVQQYQPILGGPSPRLEHFFDDSADEWIDRLIRIMFPQNMKSMERYYRWVSKEYAKTFNRIHRGLVDTIFRYNNRFKKGRYLATLAGTRKGVPLP